MGAGNRSLSGASSPPTIPQSPSQGLMGNPSTGFTGPGLSRVGAPGSRAHPSPPGAERGRRDQTRSLSVRGPVPLPAVRPEHPEGTHWRSLPARLRASPTSWQKTLPLQPPAAPLEAPELMIDNHLCFKKSIIYLEKKSRDYRRDHQDPPNHTTAVQGGSARGVRVSGVIQPLAHQPREGTPTPCPWSQPGLPGCALGSHGYAHGDSVSSQRMAQSSRPAPPRSRGPAAGPV